MTVRQKILIPRFLFLLSLNILKNGQYYCACAARWEKTPNQLDALETTALFATSFPGFFFREVRRHSGGRSRQDPYSNTRGSTHYWLL